MVVFKCILCSLSNLGVSSALRKGLQSISWELKIESRNYNDKFKVCEPY